MPSNGVHELIDPWQWKRIIRACFIEVCIINTDALFSIRLLHHDYISQSFRVVSFPDELGFEELVDLLTNHSVLLRVEPVAFLNDTLMSGVNIELVDDDC